MIINSELAGNVLTIKVEGRIDSATAPQLDTEIKERFENAETLIFDFSELEYISSAGLRVLLTAQKAMDKRGNMLVKNVNETVLEVFEVTGFSQILNIE